MNINTSSTKRLPPIATDTYGSVVCLCRARFSRVAAGCQGTESRLECRHSSACLAAFPPATGLSATTSTLDLAGVLGCQQTQGASTVVAALEPVLPCGSTLKPCALMVLALDRVIPALVESIN